MSTLGDVNIRLGERRAQASRQRLRNRLVAAGVVILVAGLVYLVGFSPLLSAREVSVKGHKLLSKTEVVGAAGIPSGTPLVWVDASGVAERVAGLPQVAEVSVARSWPDAVTISIRERKPRLALPAGAGYLLADSSGVIFNAVENAPGGLVVVDADPHDRQVLADVGAVFSALSPGTAAKVVRMSAPSRDGIVLRLKSGAKVIWGSAEQSNLKGQVLDALLPLGGHTFNVSAPAFPARH